MTPEEAIKMFEEDLEHTRQHLQDKEEYKEQNPEFYEELKRWEQAEELAIKALNGIQQVPVATIHFSKADLQKIVDKAVEQIKEEYKEEIELENEPEENT